jgi:hypothetical protein
LYATIIFAVLLSQLSKSHVIFSETFTGPPSKHWSQLFVANAGFEEQLSDLYSPIAEPRGRLDGESVAPGFGAALNGVVTSEVEIVEGFDISTEGVTGLGTVVPVAKTECVMRRVVRRENETIFRIEKI